MNDDIQMLKAIEEQIAVQFTGKINVLSTFNRQYLGHILFKDGEIYQTVFNGQKGLKAFYQLIIQELSLGTFSYVVEPELVENSEKQIHFPYAIIKNKMSTILKDYRDSLKFRPPEDVKILIDAEFLSNPKYVTPQEFNVLEVLTEWSSTFDIYQHSQLLDHEITMALVGLRKKGALKILSTRHKTDDRI